MDVPHHLAGRSPHRHEPARLGMHASVGRILDSKRTLVGTGGVDAGEGIRQSS